MANTFIAYQNRVDESTLAGGSWETGLPLSNLKYRLLSKPARTTNDSTSSTQFTVTFPKLRPVQVIALCRHNLSITAKVRFRAYTDAGFSSEVYDSGWKDVWPSVHQSIHLEWEADNFWLGQMDAEELEGYQWNTIHIMRNLIYQRYWKIEIDDTDNPAGFVEIGRLFMANGWQPVQNMDLGATLGYVSRTDVQEAHDGTEYFDQREPYRVAQFTLGYMDAGEAMGVAFDMVRRVDVSREVLYVYDPDDTAHLIRRSFLGRLRELSPIEQPFVDAHSTSFSIKELL